MRSWVIHVKFTNKITGKEYGAVCSGTTASTFEKAVNNVRHKCIGDVPCTYVDLGSYEVIPKEVEEELYELMYSSRELSWEEKYQNLLEKGASDQELADLDDLLK